MAAPVGFMRHGGLLTTTREMYMQPGALLIAKGLLDSRELLVLVGRARQDDRPRGTWYVIRITRWGESDQRTSVDARQGWWLAECKELADG